ncbi:hypothetical protein [Nonomuraea sp. NPDC048916]|uniref:hypothetical protein n=1 Tax=Nonomuraea sp. NPDC048916 TaxID=3154232 RepID=UPI0033C89181
MAQIGIPELLVLGVLALIAATIVVVILTATRRSRRNVPAAGPQDDLATRVRRLKEAGRTQQAIFLVRGETGIGQDEAAQFVNSL